MLLQLFSFVSRITDFVLSPKSFNLPSIFLPIAKSAYNLFSILLSKNKCDIILYLISKNIDFDKHKDLAPDIFNEYNNTIDDIKQNFQLELYPQEIENIIIKYLHNSLE